MRNFLSCFSFALIAGVGCRSSPPVAAPPQGVPVSSRPFASAIRVKPTGGTWEAYRLPTLARLQNSTARLPRVDSLIGVDLESDVLYVRTVRDDILAVDLVTERVDTAGRHASHVTLGPDGTLYTVDARQRVTSIRRRSPRSWRDSLPAAPDEIFAAGNERLLVVNRGSDPTLAAISPEQTVSTQALAGGGPLAATRWGELVAVGADAGVLLVDPLGRRAAAFLPVRGTLRALAFSPSGHRLYAVRREHANLATIDRFARRQLDAIPLPAPPVDIRLDPLGRWLLARPAVGDSAWIVELASRSVTGTLATSWQADLPAIGPDGTVLVRQGADVVAIAPESLQVVARIPKAAGDLWLVSAWRPRGLPVQAADDAAAGPATDAEGPLYVQVSVSQNQLWSTENAQQLIRAGLPAQVLAPRSPEDGYRVVLGPYQTRDEAEAMGRKLGRPFWIYQADRPQ